ncbi:hypothetical protein FJ251_06280 [bacterium]|nr:hypothetical protein [bacterium]
MDAKTHCVQPFGGEMVVGGRFAYAGGTLVNSIASWDGQEWTALGAGLGGAYPIANVLCEYEGALYVGGDFDLAGGLPASNLGKWCAGQWVPTADISGEVGCMTVYNGDLIVGGGFNFVYWDGHATYTGPIAGSNGSEWFSVGQASGGGAIDLAVFDGYLVAGGDFYSMGGDPDLDRLARWDGQTWSAFDPSGSDAVSGGLVKDVEVYRGELYVAGSFTSIGGRPIRKLARWDGASWQPFGEEILAAMVYPNLIELEVYQDALFVGGYLQVGAPWNTENLMRWDGTEWTACGLGLNDIVIAMAIWDDGHGEKLYTAGEFTLVDGVIDSRYIAAWQETPVTAVPDLADADGLALNPCTPNPFNSATRLSYSLPEAGAVCLDVLDIRGRRLATPLAGYQEAGPHSLVWLAQDDLGNPLASGLYLLRLSAAGAMRMQKIVLAK